MSAVAEDLMVKVVEHPAPPPVPEESPLVVSRIKSYLKQWRLTVEHARNLALGLVTPPKVNERLSLGRPLPTTPRLS